MDANVRNVAKQDMRHMRGSQMTVILVANGDKPDDLAV
jgi:hypothetical protein